MGRFYNSNIATSGLVFHFDAANKRSYPGSGTTWTDLSGNGNDGTLTNGPSFDSDDVGSISFDGSNDYIDFGSLTPNDLIGANGANTISVWFYPDGYAQRMIMGNGNANRFYIETFYRSGSTLVVHWGYGSSQNSSTSQAVIIHNTKWYNYVATYDQSTAKGYLDGVETDSVSISSKTFGGTIKIGNWQSNLYWDGRISNISIYNRALTANEILANYNSLKGRYDGV